MILSFAVIVAGLAGFGVTDLVRRYAVDLKLVQIPNDRSSHIRPTPTGGGVGIVAGVIAGFVVFSVATGSSFWALWGAVGLATGLGLVGFVDDIKPLGIRSRLLVQFIAVSALFGLCGFFAWLAGFELIPSAVLWGLAFLCAVWWLNLFNFMDGIDGFAATQAVMMFFGATLICVLQSGAMVETPLIALMIISSAALVGFLGLNWYPARIFMGDAGSLFLGFLLLATACFTIAAGYMSLVQWLILGAVFIGDATVTLVWRLLHGQSPTRGHREHFYQVLAQRFGRHDVVVVLLGIIFCLTLSLAFAARSYGFG